MAFDAEQSRLQAFKAAVTKQASEKGDILEAFERRYNDGFLVANHVLLHGTTHQALSNVFVDWANKVVKEKDLVGVSVENLLPSSITTSKDKKVTDEVFAYLVVSNNQTGKKAEVHGEAKKVASLEVPIYVVYTPI